MIGRLEELMRIQLNSFKVVIEQIVNTNICIASLTYLRLQHSESDSDYERRVSLRKSQHGILGFGIENTEISYDFSHGYPFV